MQNHPCEPIGLDPPPFWRGFYAQSTHTSRWPCRALAEVYFRCLADSDTGIKPTRLLALQVCDRIMTSTHVYREGAQRSTQLKLCAKRACSTTNTHRIKVLKQILTEWHVESRGCGPPRRPLARAARRANPSPRRPLPSSPTPRRRRADKFARQREAREPFPASDGSARGRRARWRRSARREVWIRSAPRICTPWRSAPPLTWPRRASAARV